MHEIAMNILECVKHNENNTQNQNQKNKKMMKIDFETYLALTMMGWPPLGGRSELSCEPLFPIALPITRLTVSSTDSGPVGSVVELYTVFGPLFKDT